MHCRPLVLFLLFTCLSLVVVAQKNFLPGFVIKDAGDTMQGMIDYRNWERNPRKITFKSDAQTTYTVADLRAFTVTGNDTYVRAIVKKDMLPVNLNLLENEGYTNTVTDTVFLREVVSGSKLTLYELLDLKYHYYIKRPDGDYQELVYKILRKNDATQEYTVYNTFREQLLFGVTDEALRRKILHVSYKEEALKTIVQAINGEKPVVASEGTVKRKRLAFYAGGGFTYNKMGFSNFKNLEMLQSKPYTGLELEGGMDLFTMRRLQNLFFRLNVRYSDNSYKGEAEVASFFAGQKEKREYELQMQLLSPGLSILYTVLHTPYGTVFIGGGTALNLTRYTKNTYTVTNLSTNDVSKKEDYLDLSRGWFDVNGKMGYQYKNVELGVSRRIEGSFTSFAGYHIKNPTTALVAAFRF